ncbi:MAG TPA: GTPase, partial [Cupriavidus sp.]|nr:GTPase [Cupriavidus sp.]
MDRSTIRNQMPTLVVGHVPRNIRTFKFRVIDDQPQESALGFMIAP